MLQDKETLRLAQITSDHNFLDEFVVAVGALPLCLGTFLNSLFLGWASRRPSGRLDGHLGV